ncbi:MAG: hypothetical protein AAB433_14505 [Nitrospirota bacterium]
MVSKWPVQRLSIEEAAGARWALDLWSEPVKQAGSGALGSAEMDVLAESVALFALAFHPLDATAASHALPLFQARIVDAR